MVVVWLVPTKICGLWCWWWQSVVLYTPGLRFIWFLIRRFFFRLLWSFYCFRGNPSRGSDSRWRRRWCIDDLSRHCNC
ncbi:hypothetical protein HanXRQr2_Chr11g0472121 [Helianthus annuus]|uniref:Uncharacterized protein n=1 Tax=Helianthus annuus TaxID=4232 RepID=A0A9K3HL86_HELAN|nr:hypothetical protein HanXRQr2_Chr11g0472121 [Helianthus annuus]